MLSPFLLIYLQILIKINVMRTMPLHFKKSNLLEDVELQKYITLRVKIKANVSAVLEFFCCCLILAKAIHIWYSFLFLFMFNF